MPDPNMSQDTPFDQQLQEDVESRRTVPTAGTVRIGDSPKASPPISSPASQLPAISLSTTDVPTTTLDSDIGHMATRVRPPLPVLIGLAMALGAICVAGGALLIRRMVPDTRPALTTTTQQRPGGDTVMNPDLVTQSPSAESIEVAPQETPAIEIEELPPLKEPQQITKANDPPLATSTNGEQPDKPEKGVKKDEQEERIDQASSPNEAFTGPTYELTPPAGFSLRQKGRRTIWKHENGAQILVETGKAGKGSLTDGWLRLERDLQKRYGKGYKSLGIREGQLAGKPAAIWEFELTGKDGVTRRKIDIGIQHEGRGYAVLGSAPKQSYDDVSPQLSAAIESFKLKSSDDSQKSESVQPLPAPTRRRVKRRSRTTETLPTAQPTLERGY